MQLFKYTKHRIGTRIEENIYIFEATKGTLSASKT